MKKIACKAYGCAERRIHWCRPDEERGSQYVEVPDDYPDERPVFCSMTCAILGGYMTAHAPDDLCFKCLVAHDREIEHHSGYVCWEPEITEIQRRRAIERRAAHREYCFLKFNVKYYYSVNGEMHTVWCHDKATFLDQNPTATDMTASALEEAEQKVADIKM